MTEHVRLRHTNLLASLTLFLFWACLAPPAAADAGTVETPVIQANGALTIGATANLAIPPAGITVEVNSPTEGAAIYYTLDGTEPTEGSTLYEGPVAIAEQKNLTAVKTVTFKAKAFKAPMDPSAVATATYRNYAIPEFSMKIGVAGNTWGPNTLEFGMRTGATDGLDPYDTPEQAPENPPQEPGVPKPPDSSVVFVTEQDLQFLSVDYRTRFVTKLWKVQAQIIPPPVGGGAAVTLTWGANAGFPLPTVPYLKLIRETEPGVFAEIADLTQSGSLIISTTTFPTLGVEDEEYYRTFYILCDFRGALQVNLGPQALPADARWQYREVGSAYSDWQVSGYTTVPIHPGTYEVQFNSLPDPEGSGFYRPPNRFVTVAGGSAATVLNADYLPAKSQAAMTVSPTYDPETKTVVVECSFTYTPDVVLNQIVWTFNLPTGWSIEKIIGLPPGWTADIIGNVVTFTFTAPAGRSVSGDGYFDFDMELKFTGDEPGEVEVKVEEIVGTGSGDPVSTTPPPAVTSKPRTATLDVDQDGLIFDTDTFSYDFDDIQILFNYISWRANGFTDQQILDSGLLTAGTESLGATATPASILELVKELASGPMDVDGDGLIYDADTFTYDFDDIQILFNYISWRANGFTDQQILDSGLLTAGTESLGVGMTPAQILQRVLDIL